jgi:uncharacterized protein
MSERTSYAPGTPSWVDLATPDVEAAARFYGEVFGWEVPERPNSAEMGGYRRAIKNGKDVAGVMPLMQEGQPPAWSTYVSVEDADATAAAVTANGGTQVAEPMDVMDLGRMAVFTDPEGGFFGIWQPGTFAGAELVNEAGSVGWNELGTRDPAAAKQFYGAVFGWSYDEEPSDRVGTYTIAKLGEAMVAGMIDMNALEMPAEVPANWLVYFIVDDADATLEKVRSGGGSVMNGPIDIPPGRFAVVADPFGAAFAVMQPNEEA